MRVNALSAPVMAGDVHFPPSVKEFFTPALFGLDGWLTKFTIFVWVAVALLIIFFLVAYRDPKLVPSRAQWMAEAVYGFARDSIARPMLGHEGVRFAPYFAALLSFILLTNLYGIIPGIQISTNTHIAYPIVLAAISYVMFNYIGIRKHGFVKYMKNSLVPSAPWYILPLLIPIEFFSTFIVRPITLALRLFANMFAGHMILAVFTLGGFALLNAQTWYFKPISVLSWGMAVALTFLEALVILLQAYVFVVLTSSYISGALAEEH
ncbi:MAG: F0F1 ATP synthase subunit A [Micromonosporaceae bacterium]|nr:F0F1 ATP synthase subunit A [Micromonosporaceae bacterium]